MNIFSIRHTIRIILLFPFSILFYPGICQNVNNEFAKSAVSVGVVVEDLDKSLDFYKHVIGMTEVREFTVDENKAKKMGLSDGEKFEVKVLKLDNSEEGAEWKLMSFGKKTNHKNQDYIPSTNGIRYVTIFVKSMAPLLERINKSNTKTLGETPTMLDETRQFVLIQDPDGNFVEFIGPK